MDTMRITKIVGGFCGALLVLLLAKMAAGAIYRVGPAGHGEHSEPAFVIEVADAAGEAEAEGGEVAALEPMPAGDAAAGEKVFGKCKTCHKIDGKDGTGPHLNGVVGRDVASVEGFSYSSSMAEVAGTWTPEELNAFLVAPKKDVAGTKMSFAGLKDAQDRADVIAYLATLN